MRVILKSSDSLVVGPKSTTKSDATKADGFAFDEKELMYQDVSKISKTTLLKRASKKAELILNRKLNYNTNSQILLELQKNEASSANKVVGDKGLKRNSSIYMESKYEFEDDNEPLKPEEIECKNYFFYMIQKMLFF